jgi:hypothetical protein
MKNLVPRRAALAVPAFVALVCLFCLTLGCAPAASAQTAGQDIYAVTYETNTQQQLVRFNPATPGAVTVVGTLNQAGACGTNIRVAGIDFRPATRQLYGICGTSKVIVIDPTTAAVSLVGTAGTSLTTTDNIGTDFDPVADQYRVVSNIGGNNNRVNPTTAAATTDATLAYAAGDPNAAQSPRVSAIAYTNNSAGVTQTTLYGIDYNLDILVTVGTANGVESPNTGRLHTVGSLGVNVSQLTNFDIAPDGTAYMQGRVGGADNLYTINLATGAATLVGAIGDPTAVAGGNILGYAGIAAVTSPVCTPAPSGMTAWYPGDGNARDIQGGNHGTLVGGSPSFTQGKVNQAFHFDGTYGYVAAPSTPGNDITGDITIDAWINPTNIAGSQRNIVNKRDESGSNVTYSFLVDANGVLVFSSRVGSGTFDAVATTATIPTGVYTHVAVTISGTTLQFYINGSPVDTFTYSATRPSSTGRLKIGAREDAEFGPEASFDGTIDELELFNRALTATEIQSIYNADALGKCKAAVTNGSVLVSEFRFQGTTASDEFVELYNNTDSPIDLNGYSVVINATTITVSGSVTMPARGHFLFVNENGYTLAQYAAADVPYGAAVADAPADSSVSVLSPSGQVLDKVGFTSNPAGSCEGTCLNAATATGASGQHSYVRNTAATGRPQDTDDNASDFLLVSTDPASLPGSRLGAPGPENLSSPVNRGANIKSTLIDPGCTDSATVPTQACPRYRSATPVTNGSNGTLSIRRRFTNQTGQIVTRLRFRVVDITTYPRGGGGTADLRAISSSDQNAVCQGAGGGCAFIGSPVTIQGTTLEQPPTQSNGGGYNSTLTATLPGGGLAAGDSVNLQFLLGVQQTGSFRFFVIVEALPGPAGSSAGVAAPASFDGAKGDNPARAKGGPSKGASVKGKQ